MADYHRAPGEIFQSLFQGPEGVHVKVVGGLVKEDDVGALFEYAGQMMWSIVVLCHLNTQCTQNELIHNETDSITSR